MKMSIKVDKVFVTHHPALTERKLYLSSILHQLNVESTWVEDFPPDDIDRDNVTKREYSLLLKHIDCFRKQIKDNLERILILEDDALICKPFNNLNFAEYCNICLDQFDNLNGDLMFIGSCCNIEIFNPLPNIHVYYHESFTTRCAHCYVINLKAAKKAVEEFDNGYLAPSDWFLNYVISKYKLRSCYTNPSVYQGSTSIWSSSLR